jgi:hypothetical protein
MQVKTSSYRAGRRGPVEGRSTIVVANRVVQIETRHVHDMLWTARGLVSDPLPTGPFIRRPTVLHGFGPTESDAVSDLCRAIERLPPTVSRVSESSLGS